LGRAKALKKSFGKRGTGSYHNSTGSGMVKTVTRLKKGRRDSLERGKKQLQELSLRGEKLTKTSRNVKKCGGGIREGAKMGLPLI